MPGLRSLNNNKGSILVWVVLILTFVGVLARWGLSQRKAPTENKLRIETLDQLETVKQAYYGYAKTYKLLPRPAEWTGAYQETGSAVGPNTSNMGAVPWYDLGVKPKDPWGKKLRYQARYDMMCVTTAKACGALNKYKQNLPADAFNPAIKLIDGYNNNMLRYVPAVIVSLGPNGVENAMSGGNNSPFNVNIPYVRNVPTPTFDDVVVYLDPFVLYDVMDCHCLNLVKDEDETGVDCGGSDCIACP